MMSGRITGEERDSACCNLTSEVTTESSDQKSDANRTRNAGQSKDHRICPSWNWNVLWLSCTGNVLLMVAVILMGVHGLKCSFSTATNRSSQNSQEMTGISNEHHCKQNENKTNSQLQKFKTCLRQNLCMPTNAPTENGSCSVCPITWFPYKDKCYWISNSIQSWKQSHEDCVAKGSQLLIISDRAEQEFIQNKTNINAWIGLEFKSPEKKWMWINGSPLNHTLYPTSRATCGITGKKGIDSDMCNTENNWICQKRSIII